MKNSGSFLYPSNSTSMTRWVNKQDVMLFIHVFTLYITADSSTTLVYVWIQ